MAKRFENTAAIPVMRGGHQVGSLSREKPLPQPVTVRDLFAGLFLAAGFGGVASLLILFTGTLVYAGMGKGWIWSQEAAASTLILITAFPWFLILGWFLLMALRAISQSSQAMSYQAWAAEHFALPHELPSRAHLVPVVLPRATLDDVAIPYIVEFCEQAPHRGWSKRQWVDKFRFADGFLCDYPTWKKLCGILSKPEILAGRVGNRRGYLRVRDPEEMLSILRLSQYSYLLRSSHERDDAA